MRKGGFIMETVNRKYVWIFFSILIVLMIAAYLLNTIVRSPETKPVQPENNINVQTEKQSFYTVKDTEGNIILETGLPVYIDDEYISEDNTHYIVIKIEDKNATAKVLVDRTSFTPTTIPAAFLDLFTPDNKTETVKALKKTHVVIYHTHTDESFIPTSKIATERGKGDVYEVGKTMTETLRKTGISVSHNLTKHDPHDINAYHRSRRTVTQLLKEQPDAAFDIHRDSAPKQAYYTSINGIDTARVMIVIGRSNPHMQTNLNYAKKIKAEADKLHPGLMRGIFMGKGNYNQDLYPTALLFEIGTESLSQDMAEKGARCVSDAIINVMANKK